MTADPIARLDAFLEIYLDRLSAYQTLRQELSKSFSTGFLSLSRANHTGNLGNGRRYGQEGYDERMKAGRRVGIQTRSWGDLRKLSQEGAESGGEPVQDVKIGSKLYSIELFFPSHLEATKAVDEPPANLNLKIPDTTTSPSRLVSAHEHPSQSQITSAPPRPKPQKTSLNPLNWYGLLVPPSLRAAQTSFTTALEDQIVPLLNTTAELAKLEDQIRNLRRQAGLAYDGGGDDNNKSCTSTTTALEVKNPPKHNTSTSSNPETENKAKANASNPPTSPAQEKEPTSPKPPPNPQPTSPQYPEATAPPRPLSDLPPSQSRPRNQNKPPTSVQGC
jgi:coiled-coil domain-containing protein 115